MKHKRFAVSVKAGFTCRDNEVYYDYSHHFFDTYTEARKFAMKYPKGDTVIVDTKRLPF